MRIIVFWTRWMDPLVTKFARCAIVSSSCGGDVVCVSGIMASGANAGAGGWSWGRSRVT